MQLNQVTVPSTDLDVSVPFYRMLGLRLIVSALPNYARFECPSGDATFSIHRTEVPPSPNGVYVYFEFENLDESVAQLREKGIAFDELPTDRDWLWREARLKDPDGNQLIFFHAGKNRRHPPWRLKDSD